MLALPLKPEFFLAGMCSLSSSQANFTTYSIIRTSETLSETEFTPVSQDCKLGKRKLSQPLSIIYAHETTPLENKIKMIAVHEPDDKCELQQA